MEVDQSNVASRGAITRVLAGNHRRVFGFVLLRFSRLRCPTDLARKSARSPAQLVADRRRFRSVDGHFGPMFWPHFRCSCQSGPDHRHADHPTYFSSPHGFLLAGTVWRRHCRCRTSLRVSLPENSLICKPISLAEVSFFRARFPRTAHPSLVRVIELQDRKTRIIFTSRSATRAQFIQDFFLSHARTLACVSCKCICFPSLLMRI